MSDPRLLSDERWMHLLMVASDLDDQASDCAITELRADRAARLARERADVELLGALEECMDRREYEGHDKRCKGRWCDGVCDCGLAATLARLRARLAESRP